MRKITQQAVHAFLYGNPWHSGNTSVEPIADECNVLKLHGHVIAMYNQINHELHITDAGWPTATTKERLNGLPGVRVNHKAGVMYLNGAEWDGSIVEVTEWILTKGEK